VACARSIHFVYKESRESSVYENYGKILKYFWWFVLVIVIGLFLYSRQDDLISGKLLIFDSIVFIIWIGICLAPILSRNGSIRNQA